MIVMVHAIPAPIMSKGFPSPSSRSPSIVRRLGSSGTRVSGLHDCLATIKDLRVETNGPAVIKGRHFNAILMVIAGGNGWKIWKQKGTEQRSLVNNVSGFTQWHSCGYLSASIGAIDAKTVQCFTMDKTTGRGFGIVIAITARQSRVPMSVRSVIAGTASGQCWATEQLPGVSADQSVVDKSNEITIPALLSYSILYCVVTLWDAMGTQKNHCSTTCCQSRLYFKLQSQPSQVASRRRHLVSDRSVLRLLYPLQQNTPLKPDITAIRACTI